MKRDAAQELRRQISYSETMKVKLTEKYVAKMKSYDEKIARVAEILETLQETDAEEPAQAA